MKTLRAFLLGSALGALVGLILAPGRDAIAEAQVAEERDRNAATVASAQARPATSAEPEAQPQPQSQSQSQPPSSPRVHGTPMQRRYVGNLNTKIYHEATDANLPNEENRTYFATPEEAEAAGFRAAH